MSSLSLLKLGGYLGVALAFASLLWLAQDRFHQKDLVDAAERCSSAALTEDRSLEDCSVALRSRVFAARRAAACEAALLPTLTDASRFTAMQSCGAGTKRLIAVSDVAADRLHALEREIVEVRSAMGAAVQRAERRAHSAQLRREAARDAITNAPRSADGRIHCDADCLRQLGT